MATFRVYVNHKITAKGGGHHLGYHDVEADDEAAARDQVKLKQNEEIGDVTELWDGVPTPNDIADQQLVESVANELQAQMGVAMQDAMQLARVAVTKARQP